MNFLKKTGIVTTVSLVLWIVASLFMADEATSNAAGAPAAHTGSPANGKSCNTTNCHTGAPVLSNNSIISSNIPVSGYTAGSTYTITATVTRAGHNEFGFQISPQNAGGTILGSMAVISSTETQLINAGKYITHKAAGISASGGTKTWSFKWTAPAAGTGNVTFYGAFNLSNNNNAATGDTIMTSSMLVGENTTGVVEQEESFASISMYPNPATEQSNITIDFINSTIASIDLYSISGAKVKELVPTRSFSQGNYSLSLPLNDIEKGCYFILLRGDAGVKTQKFIVQ